MLQISFLEIHQKKNNLKATKQLEKGLWVWKLKSLSLNPIQGSHYLVIWLSATHTLRPTSQLHRFPEDCLHFTFLTCLLLLFEIFTINQTLHLRCWLAIHSPTRTGIGRNKIWQDKTFRLAQIMLSMSVEHANQLRQLIVGNIVPNQPNQLIHILQSLSTIASVLLHNPKSFPSYASWQAHKKNFVSWDSQCLSHHSPWTSRASSRGQ